MPKCVVYTYAYNAEKTLERTVQSVLNQTYQDFEYHLVDNASTDKTGELIASFARQDPRIIPSANEKNFVWHGNDWYSICRKLDPDDLFCELDADDEYKPEFLSHMIPFLRENRLDIAACGSDFLDAQTKQKEWERGLESELIIEGGGFSDYFPWYHQFMRTMWGKLYRAEALQTHDFKRTPPITYGGDTLFCIEVFRHARRAGVSSENLHIYYWSPKTLSYKLDPRRVFATKQLYIAPQRFLEEKCGWITPENLFFLLRVYYHDLKDSLIVIINSDSSDADKLGMVLELMEFEASEQLMLIRGEAEDRVRLRAERDEMFDQLIVWLMSLEDVPDDLVERFCRAGQLLCAVREREDEWLFFEQVREQFRQGQAEASPEEAGE